MRRTLLVSAFMLWSWELPAQVRPGETNYKDPTTAVLLEVLIAGGGHFYAGEVGRGIGFLAGTLGLIVAGAAVSVATSDGCADEDFYCSEEDINLAPLAVGVLAAVGLRVWGMFDASSAAKRANIKNARQTPGVEPSFAIGREGRASIGVRVRF